MKVKPDTYKSLIAIKNGKIKNIPNMILRKAALLNKQEKNLTDNSVCIVCNFRFLENKIEWSPKVKAVCHPFRDDKIFPKKIKKYLFSESDFADKLITPVSYRMIKWDQNGHDFVYFTLNSREGTRSKGIYMLPLINKAAVILGLRGLVIDYSVRETAKHKGTIYDRASKIIKKQMNNFSNLQIIKKHCTSKEVCAIMLSSRFVLVPSDADASPRLIVESLVRNRPVIVNAKIYGGWKYINDSNGILFNGITVEEFIGKKNNEKCLENIINSMKYVLTLDVSKISKSFYNNYGFKNSAKRLASIINKISGSKYDAVAYVEWKDAMEKIRKKI